MRFRYASLFLLALSLSVAVGCSKKKAEAPKPQPTAPTPPPPEPQPAPKIEPEPDVEPVPGEMVRLALPKDGGAWPWTVGKSEEPPESQLVTFPGLMPYSVTGFAVRPEVNRAVISIRVDPSAEPKKVDPKKGPAPKGPTTPYTRVIMCDLAAGRPQMEWALPGYHGVIDLSPDGRAILATHPQQGRDRVALKLWLLGSDGQLKPRTWTPHAPTADGLRLDTAAKPEAANSIEIRWAAFVGSDRVVSSSRAGQLRVFDIEGLKPLATIDAARGRPAITPDGTKVAFPIAASVALLDVRTLKVTGSRWVGTLPSQSALAFSPDGERLAIAGTGRAIFLNLANGQLQDVALPKLQLTDHTGFDKPFGWAGAAQLLADSRLYDPQLSSPLWDYSGAEFIQFRGWQVWACVRSPGSTTVIIRGQMLPHSEARSAIAAAKAQPGALALQPRSGVRIDVTGVPEDRRPEVQAMLEQRLKEIGYLPDANAPATLFASVDSPGTKPTAIYSGLGMYQYTRKPARLRLVLNEKELWNDSWATEPPFSLDLPKGTNLTDHLKKFAIGDPDYKAFSLAPIPTHFPGPNAPAGPLGNSDLNAIRQHSWFPW